MENLKRAIAFALLLAFVAGVGAGAWVSDLRAAPRAASTPSVDARVEQYRKKYDLNASQVRRVRDVILKYDGRRRAILNEVDAERWQRIHRLAEQSREELDGILREEKGPASAPGG